MKNLDKYQGCLLGGAVGDALGYTVEFLQADEIFKKYGSNGITKFELKNGVAQISDDTQMTLFTANGLILGTTRAITRGIMGKYADYIGYCYKDWLKTQRKNKLKEDEIYYSWLLNIPELWNIRAPGNTCLSAIEAGAKGTIEKPINSSKGCGGIMRVAPVGIYFYDNIATIEEIDIIGAEAAALTHGHELGYISAAAFTHIIYLLAHSFEITIEAAVLDSMETMKKLFPKAKHLKSMLTLMQKAMDLSKENLGDLKAIEILGQGWVAEETLAIAIYCALKYSNDFEKAILTAVNHGGDSDSTGALTGNIMGAYLGLSKVPLKFIENLELKDVILEVAEDLFKECKLNEDDSCSDEVWEHKYIYCDYTISKKL